MSTFSFPKKNKLCSPKDIQLLFSEGKWLRKENFGIVYLPKPAENGLKILISVPKRNMKLAVGRNRMKRIIREVYRLNQENLISLNQLPFNGLHLGIVYYGKTTIDFAFAQQKIIALFERLNRTLVEHENKV